MYGQLCFQGFGLHLSQLLALVQCLLYSAEFAEKKRMSNHSKGSMFSCYFKT